MADPADHVDVLLVSSPGGHLFELHSMRAAWEGYRSVWVTVDSGGARSLLGDERVVFARPQAPRSLRGVLPNLRLAVRLVRGLRPRVMITAGAALAVPFAWVCRLRGVDVVYVESATRIEDVSLSCRLIAPVASSLLVQWPEAVGSVRGARYAGSLLGLDERTP